MALIRIVIDRSTPDTSRGAPRRSRVHRLGAAVAGLALGAGLTYGVTAAHSSNGSGPSLSYTMLATPYKLFTNHSFAGNATASYAVSGGATTVPTDATKVLVRVIGSSAKGGSLAVFPLGSSADATGQFVNWAPNGRADVQLELAIGLKNDISFKNGAIAATATASIIGYTTQITADDITGLGANAGQVLGFDGSGTHWTDPGGPGFSTANHMFVTIANHSVDVASHSFAAGTYFVLFSGVIDTASPSGADVTCQINANGASLEPQELPLPYGATGSLVLQGFVTLPEATTVTVSCIDSYPGGSAHFSSAPILTAIQVASAEGDNAR